MININLYPEDQQRKRKKHNLNARIRIPPEIVIGAGGGLIMLLVCVHIIFLGVNLTKLAQHQALNKEWEDMQPAKKNADVVINELRDHRERYDKLKELVNKPDISWSERLNIISNKIPDGVWLKKLSLTDEILLMEGSAISRQKTEMIDVHTFTSNLKKDERFLTGFKSLEIESIQRRNRGSAEIAGFIIKAGLVSDEEN